MVVPRAYFNAPRRQLRPAGKRPSTPLDKAALHVSTQVSTILPALGSVDRLYLPSPKYIPPNTGCCKQPAGTATGHYNPDRTRTTAMRRNPGSKVPCPSPPLIALRGHFPEGLR